MRNPAADRVPTVSPARDTVTVSRHQIQRNRRSGAVSTVSRDRVPLTVSRAYPPRGMPKQAFPQVRSLLTVSPSVSPPCPAPG